jgi:hypothetical protein
MTRRNRGVSVASRYEALGWYLRGWCNHFSLVEIKTFYVNLDKWVKWVRHRDPSGLLEAMAQGRGASPKPNETRLIASGCGKRLTWIKPAAFHAGLSRWRQQLAATLA